MNYHISSVCLLITLILALPCAVSAVGNISVSSSPSGAEISVNGTTTGLSTPCIIESLPAGSSNVTLVLAGYQTYVWPYVTVTDDQTSTVSATLEEEAFTIAFESYPSGAEVYLDNVYIGYTNISGYSVGSGSRTVLMQLDGYDDQTRYILVNSSLSTVTTTFVSSVVNGSIYVTSSPSYADVYLLANYTGTSPLTLYNVTPGTYSVLFSKYGYENWTGTVTVTAGAETDCYAKLTSLATTVTPVATTATPVETFAAAPVAETARVTAAMTTRQKTVVTVPPPWPTSTAPESPIDPSVISGAAGLAAIMISRRR